MLRFVGIVVVAGGLVACATDPDPPDALPAPVATVDTAGAGSAGTAPAPVATTSPPPASTGTTEGSGPGEGSTFRTLDELAARLGCSDFAAAELDPSGRFGPENRAVAATCSLAGGTIALALFDDLDHRDAWIAQGQDYGCDAARQLQLPAFYFAAGRNWAVEPADVSDHAASEAIAATLGGIARAVEC